MKRLLLTILLMGFVCASPARSVYPLNNDWRFFFGYENSGDRARSVKLPHTWNEDALAGVYPYMRTRGIYTRSLYIPQEWRAKRLFLRFSGVETTADIFVNGSHAGSHAGAGVAFTFEITDYVQWGDDNSLLVAVDNAPRNDLMNCTDRNLYGGIVRGVELLLTDALAISPLYLGTEGLLIRTNEVSENRAEGTAELHLLIPSPRPVEVRLRIYDKTGRQIAEQHRTLKSSYDASKPLSIPFAIDNPSLWSMQSPALYRFEAEVSADGQSDRMSVKTGLRQLELTPKGLMLNGKRVALRGVNLTYDRPAAASLWSEDDYDVDFDLLRDMGANALCSPAAPHAQYLYDRCDSEGMLARIDLPFARTSFLSDLSYFASEDFEQNGEQLLKEIIAQNMHHPSIVLWGLFSDLRPVDKHLGDYLARLNSAARKMDPSRPTVAVSNQNGALNRVPEGIVWHQQSGWERGLTDDLSVWIENLGRSWGTFASAIVYGAPGFAEQQPDEYGKPTPGTLELPERRQTRFHEEYARQLAADTLLWGWWIDGLCDYGSARREGGRCGSGLVSFDRQTRKDAYFLLRALWNEASPTLHLADRRWEERPSVPQRLTLYASEGLEPVLRVNGDTIAIERVAPAIFRSGELMLEANSEVEALAGDLRDRIVIRCGSDLKRPAPTVPLQTISLPPRD